MATAKDDAANKIWNRPMTDAKLKTTGKRKTKQPPPVRLPGALYKRLGISARINARSIPKHIEYLVNIAESIDSFISRKDLLDVQSGLSKIVLEKIEAPKVDKATLFGSLENLRSSGSLSQTVTTSQIKYQASPSNPGYLERIHADGNRDVGMFKEGKFQIAQNLM